jgi:hypothetical protein
MAACYVDTMPTSVSRAISTGFTPSIKRLAALGYRVLNRRSQRPLTWERYVRLLERFPLPVPRITHPPPGGRLLTRANLRRSRVRESRSLGSVRAKAEWAELLDITHVLRDGVTWTSL